MFFFKILISIFYRDGLLEGKKTESCFHIVDSIMAEKEKQHFWRPWSGENREEARTWETKHCRVWVFQGECVHMAKNIFLCRISVGFTCFPFYKFIFILFKKELFHPLTHCSGTDCWLQSGLGLVEARSTDVGLPQLLEPLPSAIQSGYFQQVV